MNIWMLLLVGQLESCRMKLVTVNSVIAALALLALQVALTRHPVVAASHQSKANPPVESTVVLAAGDIADCRRSGWFGRTFDWLPSGAARNVPRINGAATTAKIIARHPNSAVLALGDLAYSSGSRHQFESCYEKFWGAFKNRTYPVPGNHEYRTKDAAGYFEYWGAKAGLPGKGYYRFDLGDWHLFALNSEIDASPNSKQARWLNSELAGDMTGCVLAFFHRPAFSSVERSGANNARSLFRILHKYGASVVLNGHNHFYERTQPLGSNGRPAANRGIRTFVVGTGGARYSKSGPRAGSSGSLIATGWGVLKLELMKRRYRWNFISSTEGAVLDSGEAACIDRQALLKE